MPDRSLHIFDDEDGNRISQPGYNSGDDWAVKNSKNLSKEDWATQNSGNISEDGWSGQTTGKLKLDLTSKSKKKAGNNIMQAGTKQAPPGNRKANERVRKDNPKFI